MKKSTLPLVLACLFMSGLFSCSKDDKVEACSTAWATELQPQINSMTAAGAAYVEDPTPANCNAYKAAVTSYINVLEPYGDCSALTGQNRALFEQNLQDARDSIDTLCD